MIQGKWFLNRGLMGAFGPLFIFLKKWLFVIKVFIYNCIIMRNLFSYQGRFYFSCFYFYFGRM